MLGLAGVARECRDGMIRTSPWLMCWTIAVSGTCRTLCGPVEGQQRPCSGRSACSLRWMRRSVTSGSIGSLGHTTFSHGRRRFQSGSFQRRPMAGGANVSVPAGLHLQRGHRAGALVIPEQWFRWLGLFSRWTVRCFGGVERETGVGSGVARHTNGKTAPGVSYLG